MDVLSVPRWPRGGAMLAVFLTALGCGCDLFRPATPEPPAGGSLFIPNYNDVSATLTTMKRSIELRNQQGAYLDALADSNSITGQPFTVRLDPADVAEVPAGTPIPIRWGKELERNFYSYVTTIANDTVAFMNFQSIPSQQDSTGADMYFVHRTYTLFTGTAAGDTASRGIADLRIIRVGQQWRVLHWIDRRDPNANPNLRTFGWYRLISGS